MSIKVSIIEDDTGLRESLTALVRRTAGLECASVHPNAEHALRFLPAAAPDVALVDIHLPKQSGIECVRELKRRYPRLRILMHTIYSDTRKIFASLGAGASGYLLKRTPPQKIIEAIHEVHQGGRAFSAPIARLVINFFNMGSVQTPESTGLPKLSPREEQVLRLFAAGARDKEIADQLGISVTTIRTHVEHIYEKLHVRTRPEAVARFFGHAGL